MQKREQPIIKRMNRTKSIGTKTKKTHQKNEKF